MTQNGFDKLVEELQTLKNIDRLKIIDSIVTAREYGDLSENAEYHAARERQSFIEGRISDLEDKISKAHVILSNPKSEFITFGCTVVLNDENTDEIHTYRIVGSHEANIKEGLLSVASPVAQSLIGKKKGDGIDVRTPIGMKFYTIKDVLCQDI